jgi:hypothetical protein
MMGACDSAGTDRALDPSSKPGHGPWAGLVCRILCRPAIVGEQIVSTVVPTGPGLRGRQCGLLILAEAVRALMPKSTPGYATTNNRSSVDVSVRTIPVATALRNTS